MRTSNSITTHPDPADVLAKAVTAAGKGMGLTSEEVALIIGRDRSSLSRRGLAPDSKPGELALMLIRCYRALYVLVGGQDADMQHWFSTPNTHLGGIPRDLVKQTQGLVRTLNYLDAMRGKV